MRPRTQIQHRLKQIIFRHLQKKLRVNFRKGANTCRHNIPYDLGDEDGGCAWIGRCGLVQPDGVPRGVICDARIDQDAVGRGCPFWEPVQTKDEIRQEFETLIKGEDRGPLAAQYPDIAALMWVMDDPADPQIELPTSEELAKVENHEPSEPETSWWRKVGRIIRGSPQEGEGG